jgi:hypothetical protein
MHKHPSRGTRFRNFLDEIRFRQRFHTAKYTLVLKLSNFLHPLLSTVNFVGPSGVIPVRFKEGIVFVVFEFG